MPEYLILPTFFVVWFITMFVVLPFGLGPPDKDNPHHYAAAPGGKLNIKKKLIYNTILAIIVTALIHLICLSGWIEVRG